MLSPVYPSFPYVLLLNIGYTHQAVQADLIIASRIFCLQFAQMIEIQNRVGRENFPLIHQAYYPNHREMVSNLWVSFQHQVRWCCLQQAGKLSPVCDTMYSVITSSPGRLFIGIFSLHLIETVNPL